VPSLVDAVATSSESAETVIAGAATALDIISAVEHVRSSAPPGATAGESDAALIESGAVAAFRQAPGRRRRRGCARRRRGRGSRSRSARCATRRCARRGSCSAFTTRAWVVAVAHVASNRALGDLYCLLVRRVRFMADDYLLLLG
jgi:hypothetical protein